MLIDIIQAYADALHVATTLRPVPSREPQWSQSRAVTEALPAPAPSPSALRRLAGWLARHSGGRYAGRLGAGADLAPGPTGLKGCG
jgi:hypothetical protein